jgi:WD40 repeat protein
MANFQFREADTGDVPNLPGYVLHDGEFANALAFSPDGRFLVTAYLDGTIQFRGRKTGAVTRQLRNPTGAWCTAMEISPDGKRLLTGDSDGSVCVFDVSTGKELIRREGHGGYITDVTFGPGLRTALSSSIDGTALLWDLPSLR